MTHTLLNECEIFHSPDYHSFALFLAFALQIIGGRRVEGWDEILAALVGDRDGFSRRADAALTSTATIVWRNACSAPVVGEVLAFSIDCLRLLTAFVLESD